MSKKLEIESIVRVLRLLKTANCENHVRLSELAKELGVSKSELMAFIIGNAALFVTMQPVKNGRSNPGLLVRDAFTTAEENYTRPEFLERLIKEKEKTIHVSTYADYVFRGYYIQEDTQIRNRYGEPVKDDDHRKNFYLWRNTPEKVAAIEAAGHCRERYYWGGGDGMSKIGFKHCLTSKDIQALQAEGWTVEGGPGL